MTTAQISTQNSFCELLFEYKSRSLQMIAVLFVKKTQKQYNMYFSCTNVLPLCNNLSMPTSRFHLN